MRNPEFKLPDPFNTDKIFLHRGVLEQLAKNEMPAPITAEVDLTDGACNQNCRHCCFFSGEGQKLVQIDQEKLISTLEELWLLGTKAVEFVGGGEPTAHKHFLQIIEATLNIGFDVGLITNGVLAHRVLPVANKLKYIRVSLDSAVKKTYNHLHGVGPKKNDFERVIENIKALRQAITTQPGDMKLGVGYLVVPPVNNFAAEIVAGTELAAKLGVDYIVYRPVQVDHYIDPSEWTKAQKAIKDVRVQFKDEPIRVLGGGGTRWQTLHQDSHPTGQCDSKPVVAVIQANGDIAHCILYRDQRDMKVGNIYKGTFADQWFSEENYIKWQGFQVDDCPVPCKHFAYNDAVRRVRAGEAIEVNPDQFLHPNHF